MKNPIYIVEHHGIHKYDAMSLTPCLRYIGKEIRGDRAGCLLVSVQRVIEAGYSIRTC